MVNMCLFDIFQFVSVETATSDESFVCMVGIWSQC